jgi:hypothetical protein
MPCAVREEGWYGSRSRLRTGGWHVFDGLMPAMVTPFDEQGELDFDPSKAR